MDLIVLLAQVIGYIDNHALEAMLPAAVEQGCLDQPGGLVVQVKSSQT